MRNRNGSPPSSLDSVQTEKNSDSADGSRFRCQMTLRGVRGGDDRAVVAEHVWGGQWFGGHMLWARVFYLFSRKYFVG
ncbi:hypothetical protein ERO13_A08G221266v2 [Gossypium hirsutum]|nr:hypothetical protein ERO13_A08G221266v2 [Gossypium hirsutum]